MERTHQLSLLFAFLYLYDALGGTLERTLDYGPFGESLGTDWAATSAPAARKLFIGKEKLKSDDTELYDFGARRYDPTLPRWTSVDPLARKYPGISPYAYCAGIQLPLLTQKEQIGIGIELQVPIHGLMEKRNMMGTRMSGRTYLSWETMVDI